MTMELTKPPVINDEVFGLVKLAIGFEVAAGLKKDNKVERRFVMPEQWGGYLGITAWLADPRGNELKLLGATLDVNDTILNFYNAVELDDFSADHLAAMRNFSQHNHDACLEVYKTEPALWTP